MPELIAPPSARAERFSRADRFSVARARPPRVATIASVAGELPLGRLTTSALAQRFDLPEEWILSRTGIRERPVAAPEERLSDYAARAGAKALAAAGVSAAELDLVLVATMTEDELTPNTAPLVAGAIGAVRAGAFDIGAACTGFVSALSAAAAQVESGRAEHVLVIGADFITRITDYDDRRSAPLFADGAGAVLVSAVAPEGGRAGDGHGSGREGGDGRAGGIGPILLGADADVAGAIVATHDERKLRMDGPEVFRHATRRMTEATLAAVDRAGLALEEIDLFVYHQANARITRALGERLGLEPGRVVDCIATLGNSSAATIPLALEWALSGGRLRPGANVLLCAFGAGFTWGAGVITWDPPLRDGPDA